MVPSPFEASDSEAESQDADDAAPARERKIKAAMAWLKDALKDGPRPGKEVEAAGIAAGHARTTLHIARQRAYIRSERIDNRYIWSSAAQRKQAREAESKLG